MDRIYFAAAIIALALVVWFLAIRNNDLGDDLDGANKRIETIKQSQEISDDVSTLDDDSLADELRRRLQHPSPE